METPENRALSPNFHAFLAIKRKKISTIFNDSYLLIPYRLKNYSFVTVTKHNFLSLLSLLTREYV